MQPVIPTITKFPPVLGVDQSPLSSNEFIPLQSLSSSPPSSIPLQEDSLTAFLAPEPKFFIGRKEQLETLHKILQDKKILVIIPEEDIFCRIGKSAITSQYVKSCSPVFWISARSRKALDTSFVKLAKLFGLEPSKIKDYLSVQGKLIVFDGAQDHELLKGYIPQGKCQVIITSRQREWPFPQIEIGPFSPEEAVDFLCQLTHKGDRVAAKRIAEELDCLPTSLEKAAHMIVEHQAELAGYPGIKERILDANNQRLKERSNLGDRNRNFTGRETGLVSLEEALKIHSRAVITGKRRMVAEVGLGGVGKTQIALQYAFRNADKYPYLVWRLNCDNETTLQDSYRVLAEKMGVYLTGEEKKQENALIKKVNQRLERETEWLLIFDNAENQDTLKGLIPNQGGHVLITSRSPDWEETGVPKVFKVGVFKRKESKALIQKVASLNETDANLLAELVQDLPIAVSQASAYIHETKIPYAEYARLFKEKSQLLLPAQDPTDEYSKTINITWQISMEKIAEREKVQAEALSAPCVTTSLMNVCAFLGSSNIPRKELLLPWLKSEYNRGEAALNDLNRALQMLRNFSMIEMDESTISIHDLVQLVTKNQMPKTQQKKVFEQALIILTEQMDQFKEEDVKTWINPKLCMSHSMQIFGDKDLIMYLDFSKQFKFIIKLNTVYRHFENAQQTLKINQRCLTIAKQWYAQDSSSINQTPLAISHNNIGAALSTLGKKEEALEHFKEALKIWKALFGEFHSQVAQSHNNIGAALDDLGKKEEALEHHQEALRIYKAFFEESKSDIARSYNNIGAVLSVLGKKEEALEHFKEALKILKDIFGELHPQVAQSYNNIGAVLNALGKKEVALEHHKEAFKILKAIFGESHLEVATSHNNIGIVLRDLGQKEEALKHYKEALKIWKTYFGESHPDVALSLNNIGLILSDLGRKEDALEYFKEALKIWKTYLGESHPDVAKSHNNIGAVLNDFGRKEEALEHHQEALKIRKFIFGESHPDVAQSYNNIGAVLYSLEKKEMALENFKEALKITKAFFGEFHPDVALSLNNIGVILGNLEKKEEALEYLNEALKIRKVFFGESHIILVKNLNNIGSVLIKLGKNSEALESFQQSLNILIKHFPPTNKMVIELQNKIKETLQKLKQ